MNDSLRDQINTGTYRWPHSHSQTDRIQERCSYRCLGSDRGCRLLLHPLSGHIGLMKHRTGTPLCNFREIIVQSIASCCRSQFAERSGRPSMCRSSIVTSQSTRRRRYRPGRRILCSFLPIDIVFQAWQLPQPQSMPSSTGLR